MSRMTDPDRWYFSKDKISNSPSRQCGLDEEKEISNRQSAANFIQEMGQRLQVTQLCINTAIVYMHRFYMFHSFTKFHRNAISACALFLAAKVEEQPRKLEHVIKIAHWCLNIKSNKQGQQIDVRSPEYIRQANELVINENIMLQTLGFEIGIEHPHTSVVKCCQLVKAHKDLAQTSYFMATSSLHLTTMCLQYKPTIVACFCIHIACKWDNWEIPVSSEGKPWFCYVDETVTEELLENLTSEFLFRFEKLLDRLKRKSGSRGSLNHRSLPPPNNDKKLPSSSTSSQIQDQDVKRPINNNNNKQLINDKLNQQPLSTSRSTTESSSHNHSLPNNNAISNGPINKTRTVDQISHHKPIDVNKQSKDLHYNMMNRDKQKELTDKKPPQIKNEFNNNSSRDYNSTINKTNQSSTASTVNKYDNNKLNTNLSTLSKESLSNKDVKFTNNNNSGIDLNDKNNNKNSHVPKQQLQPTQQQNKQQQIQLEKQRQQEERNKHRPRNQDYLWNDTDKLVHTNSGINKPQSNSTSSTLPNNMFTNNSSSNNSSTSINHSFLDNLISNSSIYNSNSNSSNDNNSLSKSPKLNWDPQSLGNNEDSFDPKKDLKMEFSDNSDNSNQSGVNLNSLPSLFMNDNMINGQMESTNSSTNSNSNNTKTNITTNSTMKNSFMSIFKNDDTSSLNNNNKINQNMVKSPLNSSFNLTNNALNSNLVSNKSSLSSLNNLSNSSLNHHALLPQQQTILNSTLQQQSSSTSLNSNLSTKLSSSSNHSGSSLTNSLPNSLPNSILPANQLSANNNSGNLMHQPNNSSLLSSQSFLLQSTLPGANNGFNSTTTTSLNIKQENTIVNSTAPTIQDNHHYNSLSNLQLSNSFVNNSYSSSTNNLEQSTSLEMLGEYHHKSKSKKDKDREKHHKKHKSKDKHKKDKHKDKSKDKERSSSKHSSKEDKYSAVELNRQAPTKLIIKKDRIDDNSSNGDEKPIEKIKLVIHKNLISNYAGSDRKRKQSPKDKERTSKQIKLE